MGFRLNRTYALEFKGDLEGFEVKLRSTSIAVVFEVQQAVELKRLAELLAEHIVSWNYEDAEGKPLEPTVDNLLGLEEVVLVAIAREWVRAARGVTAPLDDGSTSGNEFQEESIPMEIP